MPHPSIIPPDEPQRLQALRRYDILDTPADGSFDRITALAARLLNTPIAIVSLVDHDRIWFKSHHGVDVSQIDREPGLCATAILGEGAYVLEDAALDPRSMANPLVAGAFGLRFYAGVPLRTHDGHNLGMLCCLDFAPRQLGPAELGTLTDLAAVVMDEIELRRAAREIDALNRSLRESQDALAYQASHDGLTGLLNRQAISALLAGSVAAARGDGTPVSVLIVDVDHFKRVNDTHGHPVGDQVLQAVATRLSKVLRGTDRVGRLGGEEFMAVLDRCDLAKARDVAERCRRAICQQPVAVEQDGRPLALQVSASIGVTTMDAARLALEGADEAIRRADRALYGAKHGGRNLVVVDGATAA